MALQSRSSGLKTADAQIYTGRCALAGFILNPAISAAATLTLHDGTDATGLVLAKVNVTTAATANVPIVVLFKRPVTAEVGIFADLTGATDYVVYFN